MTRKPMFTAAVAAALLMSGCATSSSVDKKIAEAQTRTDTKIESLAGEVEDLQEKQKQTDARLEEVSRGAAEALERAKEAGLLAKGQIALEESFTEDRVRFKTDSWELNAEAKSSLDEFAQKLKAMEKGIYIEIQGHTDDTGGTAHNDMLGQQRAESVRRYLSRQHQIPLGRMSTISYGDTLPVASNKTSKGRSQNRRVVIVVLE